MQNNYDHRNTRICNNSTENGNKMAHKNTLYGPVRFNFFSCIDCDKVITSIFISSLGVSLSRNDRNGTLDLQIELGLRYIYTKILYLFITHFSSIHGHS
jgi:hypothetical protein